MIAAEYFSVIETDSEWKIKLYLTGQKKEKIWTLLQHSISAGIVCGKGRHIHIKPKNQLLQVINYMYDVKSNNASMSGKITLYYT